MKNTAGRSIKKSIIAIFAMVIFLTSFCFALFFYIDTREDVLHDEFVSRSVEVGDIYQALDQMDDLLSEYLRTWAPDQQRRYLAASRAFAGKLAKLYRICQNEQTSLDYIRRIAAFNDFQLQMLTSPEALLQERHFKLAFIKQALTEQKNQALALARDDLRLARDIYGRRQTQLYHWKIALCLLVMVLFAGCCLYFTGLLKKMGAVLKKIHTHLGLLSRKNWDVSDLDAPEYEEFNTLAETVNQMKHEIRDHIRAVENHAGLQKQLDYERLENERKQHMLVEAQMAMLKSHINPHFLFNVLNIIGKTALLENPEKTMELIEDTARILRYTLYTTDKHVRLREELGIVRTYLNLQKFRFGNALTFEIRTPESALDLSIPAMIIQPIVENCFKHGFGNKQTLHICLEITVTGSEAVITVYDNGDGFDTGILSQAAAGGGIGLNNVRRRLELEYKRADRVTVKSRIGAFTEVSIRIPIHEEDADENIDCRG